LRSSEDICNELRSLEDVSDEFPDSEESLIDDSDIDKDFTLDESEESDDDITEDDIVPRPMDSNKDNSDPFDEDDLDERFLSQNNNEVCSDENLDVTNIKWSVVNGNFEPKMKLSPKDGGIILCKMDRSASPLDALLCLFPKSLFIYIAQNTNRRIEKENASSKNKNPSNRCRRDYDSGRLHLSNGL